MTNTGEAPLLLSAPTLSDTADFSLSSDCGSSLAAGASCVMAVQFQPTKVGQVTASLTFVDNSGGVSGAQQTVALTGTGTPVPLPRAVLTPGTLAFAQTVMGTSAASLTANLSNTGTAPLELGTVTLSDSVDFSVTSDCGAAVSPGTKCTLTVGFHPSAVGAQAATLTVTDNSGGMAGSAQVVTLSGTGIPIPVPQAMLSGASAIFPATVIGTASATQVITLTNTGTAALSLLTPVLSDSTDFGLTSDCSASLAAGASCHLSLLFQPKSDGSIAATLTLSDNSGGVAGSQQVVTLSGTGLPVPVAQAVVSPAALHFPQTTVGMSATVQSFTVTNTGTADLQLGTVSLSDSTNFSFMDTCGGSVPAGASCEVSVRFNPQSAGALNATVTLSDNSGGSAGAQQAVTLSGKSVAEVDSVTNFGDSITCGFYAQPQDGVNNVYSNEGYAGLFDAEVGAPAQNWCRQGDTAADLSRVWAPFFSSPAGNGNQLYTLMIGVNDAYRYGVAPVALANYGAEVGAALAWLALPSDAKVLASNITQRTGNWTADTGFNLNDFGLNSSDPNASLTFNVNQAVAGHQLYLVYHVYNLPPAQAGTATIAVDGVVEATVDESFNSGFGPETQNGTNDSYFLVTLPLGEAGQHTVTFTSTGPAGATVSMLWAGVPQAAYSTVAGAPRVLVGPVTTSPSGNQAYAANVFNQTLRTLVQGLASDGMNLLVVPTDTALDPATDFVDLLHPNNGGHAKLAAVFEGSR